MDDGLQQEVEKAAFEVIEAARAGDRDRTLIAVNTLDLVVLSRLGRTEALRWEDGEADHDGAEDQSSPP